MADNKTLRLNKVLRELNISLDRAVEHLTSHGHDIDARPTTKISNEEYNVLLDGFQTDRNKKAASKEVSEEKRKEKEALRVALEEKMEKQRLEEEAKKVVVKAKAEKLELKTVGKIDIEPKKEEPVTPKAEVSKPVVEEVKKEAPKKPEVVKETIAKTPKVEEKKQVEEVQKETPKEVKKETPKEVKKEAPKTTKEAPKKEVAKPKIVEPVAKKEEKPVKEDKKVKEEPTEPTVPQTIETQYKKLSGPKMTGEKIDLKQFEKPKKKKPEPAAKKASAADANKKKRRRIVKKASPAGGNRRPGGAPQSRGANQRGPLRGGPRKSIVKEEPTEADVQKQIRETLEKLQGKSKKGKGAKYRRDKRDQRREQTEIDQELQAAESKVLKVTEFVTVSEIATMMNIPVTNIISTCMSLGMMVTMNQRLDAETLTIVAEEFDYTVDFIGVEVQESIEEHQDTEDELESRAPVGCKKRY